jgi:hypothetical protein
MTLVPTEFHGPAEGERARVVAGWGLECGRIATVQARLLGESMPPGFDQWPPTGVVCVSRAWYLWEATRVLHIS